MSALQHFNFHGDSLDVAITNGVPHVSVRRVCDALGVDRKTQLRKLAVRPWATIADIATVDTAGRSQIMSMISLRALPMWLATISPTKVAPEVREKLAVYQTECAEVLADHYLGPRVAPGDDAAWTRASERLAVIASLVGCGAIDATAAHGQRVTIAQGLGIETTPHSPHLPRVSVASEADESFAPVLAEINDAIGDAWFSAAQAFAVGPVRSAMQARGRRLTARSLGMLLARARKRPPVGWRVTQGAADRGRRAWRVEKV